MAKGARGKRRDSYEVFQEQLYERTIKELQKGYKPEWFSLVESEPTTDAEIRQGIREVLDRETYDMQIAGIKERALEETGKRERNANRELVNEYLFETTRKQAQSIKEMFKDIFDVSYSTAQIRRQQIKEEDWQSYQQFYHDLRAKGATVEAIQSMIWGS